MKTSQLLKILPDEDKKEFIKDYYAQVKEGLKESNTTAWKFCFYSILIVLLYYAFDAELIKKVSLGRISVEDLRLVEIATPLLFSFCYYIMAINLAKYGELRVQYDVLLYYFTKDDFLKDKTNMMHSCVLPLNYIDSTIDYLFAKREKWSLIYGLILLIPIVIIFGGLFFFLILILKDLPYLQLPIISYATLVISAYLLVITGKVTGTGFYIAKKDRKLAFSLLD
jgi:hypothetical protein